MTLDDAGGGGAGCCVRMLYLRFKIAAKQSLGCLMTLDDTQWHLIMFEYLGHLVMIGGHGGVRSERFI